MIGITGRTAIGTVILYPELSIQNGVECGTGGSFALHFVATFKLNSIPFNNNCLKVLIRGFRSNLGVWRELILVRNSGNGNGIVCLREVGNNDEYII